MGREYSYQLRPRLAHASPMPCPSRAGRGEVRAEHSGASIRRLSELVAGPAPGPWRRYDLMDAVVRAHPLRDRRHTALERRYSSPPGHSHAPGNSSPHYSTLRAALSTTKELSTYTRRLHRLSMLITGSVLDSGWSLDGYGLQTWLLFLDASN